MSFSTLPAGHFVTLRWHGHPDQLEAVTAVLIGWVRLTERPLDVEERADGDHFACRLEIYETDPAEQPDRDQWVTELAFKLKDWLDLVAGAAPRHAADRRPGRAARTTDLGRAKPVDS